ncbi:coproporphyrinogen III oxidase [Escherichia coli]|nr:coproporphyrinogen III oxidase [Escherichia coli]
MDQTGLLSNLCRTIRCCYYPTLILGSGRGLKTGGRIESILVSLPLTARWEYGHQPAEGTEEWRLLDACINPKEWI